MKKTDKISYRQKSDSELTKLLADLRRQLVEKKIDLHTGKLKDTSVFKKIKQEIAMISTILHEK